MRGFKKKQMDRTEGSFLHLHSVGCLEDACACLYCLFLRRSMVTSSADPRLLGALCKTVSPAAGGGC